MTKVNDGWRTLKTLLRPAPKKIIYSLDNRGVIPQELRHWQYLALVAMTQADHWMTEWNKVRGHIVSTPEWETMTEDNQRKTMGSNFDLSDANAKYQFAMNEANRYHTAIIAQLAMRKEPV